MKEIPHTISDAWLKQQGACANERARFREVFGAEVTLARANLVRALEAKLEVFWLAVRLLDPASASQLDTAWRAARDDYDAAVALAYREYQAATHSVWLRPEYHEVSREPRQRLIAAAHAARRRYCEDRAARLAAALGLDETSPECPTLDTRD